MEMFLGWFWDSKFSGSIFFGKTAKNIIYDNVQVNGGSKYEYSVNWATLGSQDSYIFSFMGIIVFIDLKKSKNKINFK